MAKHVMVVCVSLLVFYLLAPLVDLCGEDEYNDPRWILEVGLYTSTKFFKVLTDRDDNIETSQRESICNLLGYHDMVSHLSNSNSTIPNIDTYQTLLQKNIDDFCTYLKNDTEGVGGGPCAEEDINDLREYCLLVKLKNITESSYKSVLRMYPPSYDLLCAYPCVWVCREVDSAQRNSTLLNSVLNCETQSPMCGTASS